MNDSIARPVLIVSFVATSFIGVAFLLTVWLDADSSTAIVRSSIFVAAMAVVHVAGLRLYETQNVESKAPQHIDFSKIQPHLRLILLTQISCHFLAAMLLDGGAGFRTCVATAMVHWSAMAVICSRKRKKLSVLETLVVRWGFLVGLVTVVIAITI